jgi:uncharacterized protein YjdB
MKVTVSGELVFDLQKDEGTPHLVFWITTNGVKTKTTMLILQDGTQVRASIQPVDAEGNPAKVDGIPTWSSSDKSIVDVTNVATDGLSANVMAIAPGSGQINVVADADLGEGSKPIRGVLDVSVTAGEAVSFQISTSEPEPIPKA